MQSCSLLNKCLLRVTRFRYLTTNRFFSLKTESNSFTREVSIYKSLTHTYTNLSLKAQLANNLCIPITFNNPLKASFLNKKYPITNFKSIFLIKNRFFTDFKDYLCQKSITYHFLFTFSVKYDIKAKNSTSKHEFLTFNTLIAH